MLVLVPLFSLARRLADDELALACCLLYVTVPSVQLITLHTDQVFFPLCFTATVLLAIAALHRASPLLGLAAGVAVWLDCFLSFGMVALAPMLLILAVGALLRAPSKAERSHVLLAAMMIALGAALTSLLMRALFAYDTVGQLIRASAAHAAWKSNSWTPGETIYSGGLDLLELAFWSGTPIACLLLLRWTRFVGELRRERSSLTLLAGAAFATLFVLAFFGHTRAETARLWLFLVPILCLLAADEGRHRFGPGLPAWTALALSEWSLIWMIKRHMDFF